MSNTKSIRTLLDENDSLFNKKGQQEISGKLIQQVTDGEINPMEAVVKMKAMYECIGQFLKSDEVRHAVIDETEKYGKGEETQYRGANVRIQETGAKFDFSSCQDPVWERLNEQITSLKEKIDEREKLLKRISEAMTLVDEETGEVYTIYPAPRSSKTNFVITFKKE